MDSPLVSRASVLFAFNRPSLDRFLGDVTVDGLVIYDSSLISDSQPLAAAPNLEAIGLPATTIAESLGSARVANVVALGAYMGRTRILPPAAIEAALHGHNLRPETISLNMRALEAGMRIGEPIGEPAGGTSQAGRIIPEAAGPNDTRDGDRP